MKKLLTLTIAILLINSAIFSQFGSENDISKSASWAIDAKGFDIDNDGDLDVLAATWYKIVWYENLGGGTFGPQQIISNNVDNAWSVYAADIDNDGDFDVLSASFYDNKIAWYENLGGGTFGPQQIISTNTIGATSVFAVDLNNDGNIDVLSASSDDNKIAWYENLGGGTFGPQQIISINAIGAKSIYSSDLDNDGDFDVLSASSDDDKIAWYENLGGGVFSSQQVISSTAGGVHSVYSADLDNDGDFDVLSASTTGNYVSWYENLGGAFGPRQYIATVFDVDDAKSVYAADLDGDGDVDVLSASFHDNKIAWYENLGGAVFGPQQILTNDAHWARSVYAADFDSDGDVDVLSTSVGDDNIAWHENLGGGVFNPRQIINTGAKYAWCVYSADLDGDGDKDVLSASRKDNRIAWYENLGSGTFGPQQIITDSAYEAYSVYSIDLDGDGDFDVLSASADSNRIAWHENLGGGTFGSQQIITDSANQAISVYASDLDNDGDFDVLSASFAGNIAWYENLGGGSFGIQQIITNSVSGATSVYTDDLDSDGDKDVLSASKWDNKIAWYENLGGGVFGPQQVISTNANRALSVYTADLDLDGDIDVLSASDGDDKIAWYENLGGGTFGVQQIITNSADGAQSVNAADLDGDGDFDVISASQFDNKIAWYENLGGGAFSSQQIISLTAVSAISVHVADLDGDGDLDVLSTSYSDAKIAWYENFIGSPYKLTGNIFYDENQNKLKDNTELGLSFIQTSLTPNGAYSYTSAGYYSFTTDSGTYTINHYNNNQLWNLTTDSTTYTQTLTGTNPVIDSLDFGFYPDTIITVIHPNLTGGFPRCNDTSNYWINIRNEGTTLPSGVIHLQLDDSISYISAAVTPDSIINQNIYWHYDSLFFYSSEMINLQVQMPPFTSMGDTLTSILTVHELDSLGSSNIIYSNTDTLYQILVCAYDPNDKSVTPKGLGSDGYIAKNQELEYLIRFQNTGNDTAITVMVRDQLDNDLDWSSLQPIASSHPMQVWIEQDGEAVFKFENIMLPDSGADFLGSQGFVNFTIKPKANLSPNTPIYNAGHIYFDYNPAVITNIVLNTIECYGTPQPIINYNFPYLESGVSGNYSYQWYLNDTLIAGAISATYTPLVNGDYTVTVLDTNNCPKHSLPYTYNSIGIEEISQLKSVVFPNPFSEFTTILFDKSLIGEYDLLVYDIVGKEVKRARKIMGNKVIIDKRDTGKGLFLTFLVNNQTGEKIFIEKLVVQ